MANESTGTPREFDAVIIGAGVAGIGMLRRLRDEGYSVRVLEAAGGVGGTWWWNRYPGACADSAAEVYSYTFSDELLQSWTWETRFPTQPQILSYLEHVVDRFDLGRDIQLNARVASAVYDREESVWRVTTESGETFVSKYCLTAVGNLSEPLKPYYEGMENFKGQVYQTGQWPHEGVDLTGKRVAVMGTGSSGIQIIPQIAKDVAHLTVFQRTANYAIPARNRPLTKEENDRFKANYPALREQARWTPTGNLAWPDPQSALKATPEERKKRYEKDWAKGGFELLIGGYHDIFGTEEANATASDFVRDKIRETVKDPVTREKLIPKDHGIGLKRPPLSEQYFETFNRDNVSLVDLRTEPITQVTENGITTSDGEYALDVIILATGFDAVTGALNKIDIRTSDGKVLRDEWANGPRTYLGVASAGFPNLFMVSGPQSPSIMATVTQTIEQHIEWIGDLMVYSRDRGDDIIEATPEAQDAWVDNVNEIMNGSLMGKVNSWYVGANIEGKPRAALAYIAGLGTYRKICNEVRELGYEGFTFSRSGAQAGAAALTESTR